MSQSTAPANIASETSRVSARSGSMSVWRRFRRHPGPYAPQQRDAQARRAGLFADPAPVDNTPRVAMKGALERHGALYPVGTDGRALAPVLPRPVTSPPPRGSTANRDRPSPQGR